MTTSHRGLLTTLLHNLVDVAPKEPQRPADVTLRHARPPSPHVDRARAREGQILHEIADREIRGAPEVARRAIQVARLTFRLRRARASLRDALDALHRDTA